MLSMLLQPFEVSTVLKFLSPFGAAQAAEILQPLKLGVSQLFK